MMKNNFKSTVYACRMSFLVQGILNNFAPLLFMTFSRQYGLSLDKISLIIVVNFGIQILVDYFSATLIDYFGYRKSAVVSELLSALGLVMLAVLPRLFNSYISVLVSVLVHATGGGIIETVGSPTLQACPIENKDAQMSILHSFYCWGHVFCIAVSCLFFWKLGTDNYYLLSLFFAIIPFITMLMFLKVPIQTLTKKNEAIAHSSMFKLPIFRVFIVLMLCSGAAELSIAQWVSTFAESALGIEKTVGDIVGTCMFAITMGLSRIIYGSFSKKINLTKFMILSGVMCCVCYLVTALSKTPAISLIGCVFSGITVGILWPGIYSISASVIKNGGTGMFAYLALAGDLGCMLGPTLVGVVAGHFGDNLNIGILTATIFPLVLTILLIYLKRFLPNKA